jgi:hypothetical protein
MRNGPSSDLWRGAYGKCAALPRRPPKARQEALVHRHDLGALCRSGPGHRRRRESWVRRMEYGSGVAMTNLNSVSIKMPDERGDQSLWSREDMLGCEYDLSNFALDP